MKLSFLGATETVTGSKYLIEDFGNKYLIDCGLFQGYKELRLRNWKPFPVSPKTIDSVLLTHAHLDHSGYLPLLVKNGFRGPIYASHATVDLCKIILLDAAHIQEEDTRRANRYGYSKHHPAEPLYTEQDAEQAMKHFKAVNYDKFYSLKNGLAFNLEHSGHILGSSFITLKNSNNSTLVFSGDVGRPNDKIMKHPATLKQADYLVLESTYGNRKHPATDGLTILADIINSTIKRGGIVIIPSFAVGRAQTVLYYLYLLKEQNRIPSQIPVYLDSPMAQDVTELWCKYTDEHTLSKETCSKINAMAKYVRTKEESKSLNNLSMPAIIISSSGMAEGGRVLHYIEHYAPKAENTILFVGFQAAGSRGDRMLKGEKEVKIHGQMIPVLARVESLDTLSSHADYEELLVWLKGFESPPKQVFITHGEPAAAEALKAKIEEAFGWNVVVPHYLETFDLV